MKTLYNNSKATTPDGICNPVCNVLCFASGFRVRTKRKRRGCKPRRAQCNIDYTAINCNSLWGSS